MRSIVPHGQCFRNNRHSVSMGDMPTDEADFGGMRVAAFESRRAEDMARLIQRHNGRPSVSPSMREVALDDHRPAVDFANLVITGQVDIVIFMTGVGFRQLMSTIERHVDSTRFLAVLSDITTLARGPKPVAAMRETGLAPTYKVPEPNTWREVLDVVDHHLHIAQAIVGLQEYGQSNASLIAGLEARGGRVIALKVYRWALPEDLGPLQQNIHALCENQRDVVLFTSAHQVTNVLHMAESLGRTDELRNALSLQVVASIGPTTSQRLRECDIAVDIEPKHSKMGHLVAEAARRSGTVHTWKRQIAVTLSGPSSHALDEQAPWYDSPFMKACRREATPYTPIWLMRQAGRYLPEYREVRAKTTFLELCKNPQLCSEVMVTAVQRLGVDAAIIFSDLLPILEPMGLDLEYEQGEGPVIHNPVREATDVDRVTELESIDALHFVTETVRQTRQDLPEEIPLIGFAGAPFTLASYVIEGGASRSYLHTKTLMYRDHGAWEALMQRFVRAVTLYLNAQIAAGAQCVQLFDSWAGCLGVDDYRDYVLPFVKQITAGIIPGVPVISFATGNPALLGLLAAGRCTVVGVDWRVPLGDAWQTIGTERAVQGNLDPAALLAQPAEIRRKTQEILDQADGRPGHIFNLGHGVLPQTPVDNVRRLVDLVHELSG